MKSLVYSMNCALLAYDEKACKNMCVERVDDQSINRLSKCSRKSIVPCLIGEYYFLNNSNIMFCKYPGYTKGVPYRS